MKTSMYFPKHRFVVEIDGRVILTEIKIRKTTGKQKQKNILIANSSSGLILMQRDLIFFLKLVKYKITLLNEMKKN